MYPVVAMVNRKKYRDKNSVVTIAHEPLFKLRCEAQLRLMEIEPTTDELPIFGTLNLHEKSIDGQYMPKLRVFVAFLLDNKEFDDSLVLFYPFSPKGVVTCQDKPVSLCLLSKTGTKGTPLKDTNVSSLSLPSCHGISHPLCHI